MCGGAGQARKVCVRRLGAPVTPHHLNPRSAEAMGHLVFHALAPGLIISPATTRSRAGAPVRLCATEDGVEVDFAVFAMG